MLCATPSVPSRVAGKTAEWKGIILKDIVLGLKFVSLETEHSQGPAIKIGKEVIDLRLAFASFNEMKQKHAI